ncbi:hypothetical protein TOTORO_00240 [Serratia phage vB_SmaS-Totoro]|nr:hypothetical protein TOTORO_00240 [Serratia phage vB_SmaS-Totoro]
MERVFRLDYPAAVHGILKRLPDLEFKYRFLYSMVNTAIWTGLYDSHSSRLCSFSEHYYNDHVEVYEEEDDELGDYLDKREVEMAFLNEMFVDPVGIHLIESAIGSMGKLMSSVTRDYHDPTVSIDTVLLHYYDISVME